MSIYLSRVNQKLFNARQLLADLEGAADPRRRQLLLESLLLQLHLACHFHLRHIAAQYQCQKPEAVQGVDDLARQLEGLGKAPAEAGEIQSLGGDPSSWLGRLTACWQALFQATEPPAPREAEGLIPLAVVDTVEEFTPELGAQWLAALTEMIERHREGMVEC